MHFGLTLVLAVCKYSFTLHCSQGFSQLRMRKITIIILNRDSCHALSPTDSPRGFRNTFQTPMEVDKAPATTLAADVDKTPASVVPSDKDRTPAAITTPHKDKTSTPLTQSEKEKDKDKPSESGKEMEKERRSEKEPEKEKEREKERDKPKTSLSLMKKHHGKVGRGRPRKVDKEAREALMAAALTHTIPVRLIGRLTGDHTGETG